MNRFGNLFQVMVYGESHQKAIGVVVDGVPAGIQFDYDLIKSDLDKRRPGAVGTTPRIEKDEFEVTSGIFNGYTTGSPIHIMIENKDVQSKDYSNLVYHPRPGHADFVAYKKYHGFNDYRGGGRFSGRVTAALVAAGSIAKMFLPFKFTHQLIQIGTLTDLSKMDEYLEKIGNDKDSVGGIVEITVKDIPVGLGEPFFQKIESVLGSMLFSIPAVKGVAFGVGFDGVNMLGSEFNDVILDDTGKTKTNNSGGISGGITNGNDLVIKVFVKPTSSIRKPQETFNRKSKETQTLEIQGRHDVAIVRRVGIVLENAVAIGLADLYLINKAYE
ncbi:MAG TPA: chorismate synthase [Acholeplasma sp.]|nr:chorismate synthase [Acholeplasma sp.]